MSERLPNYLLGIKSKGQQEGLIAKPDTMAAILKDKAELKRQGLLLDIERWSQIFSEDPESFSLHFHLEQFKIFVEFLIEKLEQDYNDFEKRFVDDPNPQTKGRRFMFESLLYDVITSQWFLLRNVVQQRLPNSPYLSDFDRIDNKVADFYFRLYCALPPLAQQQLPSTPPLVYLGWNAKLAIFRQTFAPGIISLPIGILNPNDKKSIGAAAHEVSHSIISRLPTLKKELTRKVADYFEDKITAAEKPVLKTILGWLEEMVVDCTGTALEIERHGESVMWVTAKPIQFAGIGGGTHPPFPLRPISHLTMINYLNGVFNGSGKLFDENDLLGRKIYWNYQDIYSHRFESVQALAIISLDDVKTLMIRVLNYVLKDCQLDVLEGQTLGLVLQKCVPQKQLSAMQGLMQGEEGQKFQEELQKYSAEQRKLANQKLFKWGVAIREKGNEFVLDIPATSFKDVGTDIQLYMCRVFNIGCVTDE